MKNALKTAIASILVLALASLTTSCNKKNVNPALSFERSVTFETHNYKVISLLVKQDGSIQKEVKKAKDFMVLAYFKDDIGMYHQLPSNNSDGFEMDFSQTDKGILNLTVTNTKSATPYYLPYSGEKTFTYKFILIDLQKYKMILNSGTDLKNIPHDEAVAML